MGSAHIRIDVVLPSSPRELIYHIAHPDTIAWSTILAGLESAKLPFKRVAPTEWLDAVEKTEEEDPSRQMLGLWRGAYGTAKSPEVLSPVQSNGVESMNTKQVEDEAATQVMCTNALRDSATMREMGPVEEEQVGRMVDAWRRSGFLQV